MDGRRALGLAMGLTIVIGCRSSQLASPETPLQSPPGSEVVQPSPPLMPEPEIQQTSYANQTWFSGDRKPKVSPDTYVALGQVKHGAAKTPGRAKVDRDRLFEEARVHYQQALQQDPKSISALEALAKLYLDMNQIPMAMKKYDQAIQLAPPDQKHSLWRDVGRIQARHKQFNVAIHSFQQALQYDPENRTYAKDLAFCMACTGRTEEAFALLHRTGLTQAEARFNLAQALDYMKDPAGAQEQLRLCLQAAPNFPRAQKMLAKLSGQPEPNLPPMGSAPTHASALPASQPKYTDAKVEPQPVVTMPNLRPVPNPSSGSQAPSAPALKTPGTSATAATRVTRASHSPLPPLLSTNWDRNVLQSMPQIPSSFQPPRPKPRRLGSNPRLSPRPAMPPSRTENHLPDLPAFKLKNWD